MSTATARSVHELILPTDLPTEDGVPLESDWHRLAMTLLIELVGLYFEERDDYFVGGNMFLYFDAKQSRERNFRGPDFFFVWDVPLNPPRKYWAIWDEGGKYPDIIIELTSPTTKAEDHGEKKQTYEKIFHTNEYFIYDPDTRKLQGWRLDDNQNYCKIQPNEKGHLWSEQLGLWIGTWKGSFLKKQEVYLRFFDEHGNLVPCSEERTDNELRKARVAKRRALAEKKRADAEAKRAEAASERAVAEAKRAETEARKAHTAARRAEAEMQRAEVEMQRARPKCNAPTRRRNARMLRKPNWRN